MIALGVVDPDGTPVSNGRAYPLQILIWHEIVNDLLDGVPVLVTFCPLCNTSIVFDRRLRPDELDSTVYDFGTTGNLRHSDLVMWDRQTESWWQQVSGEAIVGSGNDTTAMLVGVAVPAIVLSSPFSPRVLSRQVPSYLP